MTKISAVILVKNAQDLIDDCLKSLSFCDEVLVIDSGSEDGTVEIAKKRGVKVLEYQMENFAKSRNFGLEKTTGDWILYVDVDERVSEELQKSIKEAVKSGDEFSAYRLKRKNFYLGNNPWPYIEKLERFFRKDKLKGWYGELHESPQVEGKIGELDGFLYHYTHRDLTSMVEKTAQWSEVEAKLRFNSNHPKMAWWRFPRVMVGAFLNSYIKQRGYKAGTAGLIESIFQSFSMFITYARLWELQQSQKNKIK